MIHAIMIFFYDNAFDFVIENDNYSFKSARHFVFHEQGYQSISSEAFGQLRLK